MIPLRDVIPSRTTPVVTIGLIVTNTLVYIYQWILGQRVDALVLHAGLAPATFSWTSVLTSMFLHVSILHIAGNMLCLWIFGDNVEDRIGHDRFLAFYVLCGAAAAIAQTAINPESLVPVIGASGAIAGVMGAYFTLYPRSRVVTLVPLFFRLRVVEVPAILFLGVWFVLQFTSGVGSITTVAADPAEGVALLGRVAGFAAGAGAVVVLRRPERQRVEWWNDV